MRVAKNSDVGVDDEACFPDCRNRYFGSLDDLTNKTHIGRFVKHDDDSLKLAAWDVDTSIVVQAKRLDFGVGGKDHKMVRQEPEDLVAPALRCTQAHGASCSVLVLLSAQLLDIFS